MQKEQLQEYLEFAKNIAREAGQVMHQYYRADQKVEEKSDHSPVTVADTIINSMLIERVKNTFPDHGVMGEEESWQAEKPVVWVCDPIDSTVSFIVHIPTFTFALALGVRLIANHGAVWSGCLIADGSVVG